MYVCISLTVPCWLFPWCNNCDSQDIGGLLFFAALFIAFTQMFQAIFTFPAEVDMIIKVRKKKKKDVVLFDTRCWRVQSYRKL